MLQAQNLSVSYGGIRALHDISFEVDKGEIVSMIGANGAGKSTTLRTISGLIKPQRGKIFLEGQNIMGFAPHKIASMGISHIPEGRGIFYNLTVMENLEIATVTRLPISLWLKPQANRKPHIKADFDRVFELFPRLAERRKQLAGTLSGGEQQMLAIGRGLIMGGKVMLLDEPSMGLAPNLVEMIFDIIVKLNKDGSTILLVEQNAYKAIEISHRVYALKTGEIAFSGAPGHEDLDDILHSAYLR
ncbi:ABC transporter ATP-binding protein [Candidatus Poribacteria bacterium]|nr:ABC transporter ATP-binding protein [Candidatus Poribacteria bacterium]